MALDMNPEVCIFLIKPLCFCAAHTGESLNEAHSFNIILGIGYDPDLSVSIIVVYQATENQALIARAAARIN
jgi:hypothetical protein